MPARLDTRPRGAKNPVVCGHRLCTSIHHQGPRWILSLYFHAQHRTPNGKSILVFSASCQACTTRQRALANSDPEVRARKRAREREWHASQRRAAGIPPRWEPGEDTTPVDVGPVAAAYRASGMTPSEVCHALGWLDRRGRGATERLMRKLGIKPQDGKYKTTIEAGMASKILAIVGVLPTDVGL